MVDLKSHRLRAIVFVWVNIVYNFNSVFVGAMPFLIAIPGMLPVQVENGKYEMEPREVACEEKGVSIDDQFNTSKHYHNLVTYLKLQCLPELVTILGMTAFLTNWGGQLFFNVMADKYGRKKVCFYGICCTTLVFGLLLFPFNFFSLQIYLGIIGFMNAYNLQAYILGVEMTTLQNRDFFLCINQGVDGLMQLIPIIVFAASAYSQYFFAVGFAAGIFVTFILWKFIPESIRYLNVAKKEKRAMKILQSLAKSTGSQNMIQKYTSVEISEEDAD